MRNLIKRGNKWYFKIVVKGKLTRISLDTGDLNLAKLRRDEKEKAAIVNDLEKLQGPRMRAGNLEDISKIYDKVGGLPLATMRRNKYCAKYVVRVGTGKPKLEPEDITLDMYTPRLKRDFQDNMRTRYEQEAGRDENARRAARNKADRTSKSFLRQACSLFCKERSMVERYREEGIIVPQCVIDFREAPTVGSNSTKQYFPPSDAALTKTFKEVEELRNSEDVLQQESYYLFWAALATGCRRAELVYMNVAEIIEVDGRLWVDGKIGKNGKLIRVPVITWSVHPAARSTPDQILREQIVRAKAAGRATLFAGTKTDRYRELADFLNGWLFDHGWKDEKKLHALRAYIGSKIFEKNPRLAQRYLRHASITTTESCYSHFASLNETFDLGVPANVVPMPAAAGAG
jgi:integrase